MEARRYWYVGELFHDIVRRMLISLAQGHDLGMGTNCLGPFLLTILLEDILKRTAQMEANIGKRKSVRVVWVSTLLHMESSNIPDGGVKFDEAGNPVQYAGMLNYMQTKCGDVHLGVEFSRKLASAGVLSIVSCFIRIL